MDTTGTLAQGETVCGTPAEAQEVSEWTAEDEEYMQSEMAYQRHIDELEEAHYRMIDGQDREREEREEFGWR